MEHLLLRVEHLLFLVERFSLVRVEHLIVVFASCRLNDILSFIQVEVDPKTHIHSSM